MQMTELELRSHKHDTISSLELVSMEGRYYMARFYLDGQGYVLSDPYEKAVLFTGAAAARDFFRDFHVENVEIIPPTGTDEMIGMPDCHGETMRVPL
ncbi:MULTISPECIES: DUF6482 family protein [Marinobacter]|uniref:Uncharacterized protein n=1 Tax=Marinobacter excellens LAMA 842 TaxID=1306954 RepID=A0A137SGH3_9GAMM|nr:MULTISPECIES: DUF6482 family protein [Marinobacter]KXO11539.1 hypothetical protein J122_1002 [Marinobacter excellens LAMA 842]MCD1629296.1 DUF6482 family protein [Marinobacter shengliensis]